MPQARFGGPELWGKGWVQAGDVGWMESLGVKVGTWFQGKLTVKPRPSPCPTASASDSRRKGQKRPCS
jgi:hypothetical protein